VLIHRFKLLFKSLYFAELLCTRGNQVVVVFEQFLSLVEQLFALIVSCFEQVCLLLENFLLVFEQVSLLLVLVD